MVNQDLYEVFVPATDSVVGAVREFHVALDIACKHAGEIWIRRNLQMEAWLNRAAVSAPTPDA